MSRSPGQTTAAPSIADRIDALLPQTQCTRCGFASCRDYSLALAAGEVAPNRCPPGGRQTLDALIELLGCEPLDLDPACGGARPWVVARIDESACIGCALCIEACPVDAILGAARRMHTVIESECSGCELCIEPCPVDCIVLEPMPFARVEREGRTDGAGEPGEEFLRRWLHERAPSARRRFDARQRRLRRGSGRRARRQRERTGLPGRDADRATKQAVIRDAVERSMERRRRARRNSP